MKLKIKLFFAKLLLRSTLPGDMRAIRKYRLINNGCGVCSVIGTKQVDMFLVTMVFFFKALGFRLQIFLVDDGTLTTNDEEKIKAHFPALTLMRAEEASRKISLKMKRYKHLSKFRFSPDTTPLKVKFDTLLLNPFKKFIYLDSDILFFRTPVEIINFIQKDQVDLFSCRDHEVASANIPVHDNYEFFFRFVLFKHFNLRINQTFNSGLLCLHNNSLNLREIDKILSFFYDFGYFNSWLCEETSLAFGLNSKTSEELHPRRYINASFYEEYWAYYQQSPISIHYSGDRGLKNKFFVDAAKTNLMIHFPVIKKLFSKRNSQGPYLIEDESINVKKTGRTSVEKSL